MSVTTRHCKTRLLPLVFLVAGAAITGLAGVNAQASPRDFVAQSDSQVLEKLPPRVRVAVASPSSNRDAASAAALAKRQIELARQSADPRYLGRAQALLMPWWDKPDAPVALMVLQATVQQARHEFAAARATLQRALAIDPSQPQAWLTLATLERLGGRYAQALKACAQVAAPGGGAGAGFYALVCELETVSLQGQQQRAREGLATLRARAPDAATQAWVLSLLGELEERAGRDAEAASAYQSSLKLSPDTYTALALADLFLRGNKPAQALSVLAREPASDAVLLRRAYALKQQNQADWQTLAAELRERFAASQARGDDPATHARERALAALWLDGDASQALRWAELNLKLQQEPLDWWLAFSAAQQTQAQPVLQALSQQLAAVGLVDARLARWRKP